MRNFNNESSLFSPTFLFIQNASGCKLLDILLRNKKCSMFCE